MLLALGRAAWLRTAPAATRRATLIPAQGSALPATDSAPVVLDPYKTSVHPASMAPTSLLTGALPIALPDSMAPSPQALAGPVCLPARHAMVPPLIIACLASPISTSTEQHAPIHAPLPCMDIMVFA